MIHPSEKGGRRGEAVGNPGQTTCVWEWVCGWGILPLLMLSAQLPLTPPLMRYMYAAHELLR